MKTALFTGTFNPFTIGHADIVERALKIFDRIVIGIGYNPDKTVLCLQIALLHRQELL